MPHRAINYIILSVLVTLWCFTALIITTCITDYRTHQNVTNTLNKVINSSMKHNMSMAYVRIYTQQSTFFHKVSSNHQNVFRSLSRLSVLLIAARTNTNSCQAWILVNFTNVAPAHSSIQYHQIFGIS